MLQGINGQRVARWTILMIAMLAALTVLLSGCVVPWPFPQPAPDLRLPDSQQIFRPVASGAYNGDAYSLDPAGYLSSLDYGIAQLIFPQLVALDGNLKPVDWAAERHEVSADGLTYTFHLRKGMTWSDGSPIDANTFAYSINRALDPCWVFSIPAPGYPLDYPLKQIEAQTPSPREPVRQARFIAPVRCVGNRCSHLIR